MFKESDIRDAITSLKGGLGSGFLFSYSFSYPENPYNGIIGLKVYSTDFGCSSSSTSVSSDRCSDLAREETCIKWESNLPYMVVSFVSGNTKREARFYPLAESHEWHSLETLLMESYENQYVPQEIRERYEEELAQTEKKMKELGTPLNKSTTFARWYKKSGFFKTGEYLLASAIHHQNALEILKEFTYQDNELIKKIAHENGFHLNDDPDIIEVLVKRAKRWDPRFRG